MSHPTAWAGAAGFALGALVVLGIGLSQDQAGRVTEALESATVDRAYVLGAAEHFAQTRTTSAEALEVLRGIAEEVHAIRRDLRALEEEGLESGSREDE